MRALAKCNQDLAIAAKYALFDQYHQDDDDARGCDKILILQLAKQCIEMKLASAAECALVAARTLDVDDENFFLFSELLRARYKMLRGKRM